MRKTEYKAKDREVKRQIAIGRGKRNWTDRIAEEAEEAANKQYTNFLYNVVKTICNEKPRQSTNVNDRNGNA